MEDVQPGDVRSNADLTQAVGQNLRWITYARIGIEITLLAGMVVLARLIPPAAFGMFAVVLIVQELALTLPMESVGSALVQRRTVSDRHLQAGFCLSLMIGLLLAGLTLVAAHAIVSPLFGAETASLVDLATPWFLIGASYAIPTAVLRRRLDLTRMTIVDLTMTSTRAAVSIALAFAGLDASALVLGNLAGMLAATALAFGFAPVPGPRWNTREMRDLLPYGGPAGLACVAWTGFRNGDYAIIGARLGTGQAGYYLRAYQLAVEYQKKVSAVMTQVAFPVLARTSGPEAMFELRRRMVRLLCVVLFPMLALLALLAPVVIPWLFGAAWEPAVVPTQILAVGGASTLTTDAVGSAFQAAGRTRALLGFGVAHFATYIGVVLVVAPHGLAAVATGAAVVHTAFLVVAYRLLVQGRDEGALRVLWGDVAPALVSCAALVAAAWPAQLALQAVGAGPAAIAAVATLVGVPAYLGAVRVGFPAVWRDLAGASRRLLADPLRRARRLSIIRGMTFGAAARRRARAG